MSMGYTLQYYIYSISGLIIILLNLILILFTEKNTEQLSTTPASPHPLCQNYIPLPIPPMTRRPRF
jgi:hypothetical protein